MYTWNKEDHSVGIEELDEQHKLLFTIINDIYNCIIINDRTLLDRLLLKIIIYSEDHFKSEKKYLLELSRDKDQSVRDMISDHILEHYGFLEVVLDKIK